MQEPPGPFVSVPWLARRSSAVTVVDARSAGHAAAGTVPGARSLPARDLNPVRHGVRHFVGPDDLERIAVEAGIGTGTVVVVGSRGGADAAHLWWTLKACGHPDVRLLDGGIEAWSAAGNQVVGAAAQGHETGRSAGAPSRPPTGEPFRPRRDPRQPIDVSELRSRLDDPDLLVLDTRSLEEYRGELGAAARGGHIPGAQPFPWTEALRSDGTLRDPDELRSSLGAALRAPEVVTYCQSGVRAAHTYAVLEALGQANLRLYLGSWGEWGNRDDTPIERSGSARAEP